MDGCEIHFAPPKKPQNNDSPVNTKQTMASTTVSSAVRNECSTIRSMGPGFDLGEGFSISAAYGALESALCEREKLLRLRWVGVWVWVWVLGGGGALVGCGVVPLGRVCFFSSFFSTSFLGGVDGKPKGDLPWAAWFETNRAPSLNGTSRGGGPCKRCRRSHPAFQLRSQTSVKI